jgi:hypothetical protein
VADVTEAMLEGLDADERKAALACTGKHTKYQPTQEEFCCPKCGAKCGDFCVDDDILNCYGVDAKGCPSQYGVGGKAFAAGLVKKKNLVPCKCCKGKGYVPRGKS